MTDFVGSENFYYFLLFAFYAVIGNIILFSWYRDRGKVRVRIKTRLGEKLAKVKPEKNKLPIEKRGRGRYDSEWEPTFDQGCLYSTPAMWGLRRVPCIDVIEGAKSAIKYDFESQATQMGLLSPDDIAKLGKAKILDELGRKETMQMPGLFWMVLIVGIINIAVTFFMAIKMGIFK